MILLFLIFLIFPAAWLVSEFRAKPAARVALGLVSMIVVAVISCQIALLKPESEKKYLHDSLAKIRELQSQKRFDKIQSGFAAYDDALQEGDGTYRASQDLWDVLISKDR